MPRRSRLTPALMAVASLALLAGTATAAVGAPPQSVALAPVVTADPSEADPLTLRIEQMTPAVLTTPRDVVISGTVTNDSDETWTEVNVAPFVAASPITDSSTLVAAADLPDDEYVGARLTQPEVIHKIASLAPGESAPFTTRLPEGSFSSIPGVYWAGVHALGVTETQARDTFADGRARTFLPVAPEGVRPLPTALVVPMRTSIKHTPDGRVDNLDSWATLLGPGGRLSGLLDVADEADDRPVTWLVDPAVPHAVSRLAVGNPGFTLTPTRDRNSSGEADGEGDGTGEGDQEPEPTLPVLPTRETADDDEPDPETAAVADLATEWLARFSKLFASADVLALPYGDQDVSALSDRVPASLAAAHTRSAEVLEALGVDSRPAITSPDGFLSGVAVENSPDSALVLLTERAISSDGAPVPTTGTLLGRPFAASSTGISQGGPGPEPAGSPLAVRQRTASEAVLRGLTGDLTPLVIKPPSDWNPADGADALLGLLDTSRFRLRALSSLTDASEAQVPADSLVYSADERDKELPRTHVEASTTLVARAMTFESVLTNPAALDIQVRDRAWTDLAMSTRRRPAAALERIEATLQHLDDQLASITISGPALATMSGDAGNIGATVINGLTVPVSVHVEVESSADLDVRVPNPISLAPESRRRLLLPTRATREGVQTLTLRVSDAEGTPLGDSTAIPVRASEVGGLLYLIMGFGALILFGAIGFRLFRRGLASRRDQGVA